MPKPILPKWAVNDVIDPISLQNNVVAPPTEKELEGWFLGEKPNRQWVNWLHRQTYLWLEYLDENLDFDADTFVPAWTGIDMSKFTRNYGYWTKEGDKVFFVISSIWNGNAVTGVDVSITNLPKISKSGTEFLQSVHVTIGDGPTFVGLPEISGLIEQNSTLMNLRSRNVGTGSGSKITSGGANGQLIISGFYFIQPI